MRRLAYAMPLLFLPLAAAACGGNKNSSATAALPDDPAAAVEGAANKTVQAGSEHLTIIGRVAARSQVVTFKGSADFDTKKHLGAVTGDFSAGGLNGSLEEVSSGTIAYVKSDLLGAFLPAGKTWVKLDLLKTAKAQGIDLTSVLSQDPTAALTQLQKLRDVQKIGPATVGGESTTRYRGTLAMKNGTARFDVWIGEDGYVHRLKAAAKTAGTTSTITTDLSKFGEAVGVAIPKPADTFDGTNASIPGLGG
jgi:hypothetical protein